MLDILTHFIHNTVIVSLKGDTMREHTAESFGEYIRRLRKDKDLTQVQLAERTVISAAYIARIETDSSTPRKRSILASLAAGLEVDEDELVSKAKVFSTSRETLIRKYKRVVDLLLSIEAISEKHSTPLTILDQKLGLFKEPKHMVARNILAVFEGRLGFNDIPPNGLRPVSHYFRAFCNSDMEKWDPANEARSHS